MPAATATAQRPERTRTRKTELTDNEPTPLKNKKPDAIATVSTPWITDVDISEMSIDMSGDTVVVKVAGRKFDLGQQLSISRDPESVGDAMSHNSTQIAWWGSLLAKVQGQVLVAKTVLAETEAEADAAVRERFRISEQKITEESVKKQVALTNEVMDAKTYLFHMEQKAETLTWICRAFQERSKHLMSIAAGLRFEEAGF